MLTEGPHQALRHLVAALFSRAAAVPAWPLAPVPPVTPSPAAPNCPACHGDRICPANWETVDDDYWRVLARCGDCEAWTELIIGNAQAAALDLALDRQRDQIRGAADRLDVERMVAQVEAFADALHRDHILAADF